MPNFQPIQRKYSPGSSDLFSLTLKVSPTVLSRPLQLLLTVSLKSFPLTVFLRPSQLLFTAWFQSHWHMSQGLYNTTLPGNEFCSSFLLLHKNLPYNKWLKTITILLDFVTFVTFVTLWLLWIRTTGRAWLRGCSALAGIICSPLEGPRTRSALCGKGQVENSGTYCQWQLVSSVVIMCKELQTICK